MKDEEIRQQIASRINIYHEETGKKPHVLYLDSLTYFDLIDAELKAWPRRMNHMEQYQKLLNNDFRFFGVDIRPMSAKHPGFPLSFDEAVKEYALLKFGEFSGYKKITLGDYTMAAFRSSPGLFSNFDEVDQ